MPHPYSWTSPQVRDQLRVTVRDQGSGMTPDVLKRVGEPFFTTKEPGPRPWARPLSGTGVRERLGGTLTLHSRTATTASIELPAGGRSELMSEDSAPPSRESRTLLVVDDDAPFRNRLVRAFRDAGSTRRAPPTTRKRWRARGRKARSSRSSICACPASRGSSSCAISKASTRRRTSSC